MDRETRAIASQLPLVTHTITTTIQVTQPRDRELQLCTDVADFYSALLATRLPNVPSPSSNV
jgi:hypothetical protein